MSNMVRIYEEKNYEEMVLEMSPERFHDIYCQDLQKEAQELKLIKNTLSIDSELLKLFEKNKGRFSGGDSFFFDELTNSSLRDAYILSIEAGMVIAAKKNRRHEKVDEYLNVITRKDLECEAEKIFGIYYSKEQINAWKTDYIPKLCDHWVKMIKPIDRFNYPVHYWDAAMKAGYRLGLTMIQEKMNRKGLLKCWYWLKNKKMCV